MNEGHAALLTLELLTKKAFSTDIFTIGFARRATHYKRADLLFSDLRQLVEAANAVGPIQVLFAGKAHPRDEAGKETIRRLIHPADVLRRPGPLDGCHAADDRVQRLLLQHAPDGPAVRGSEVRDILEMAL